MKRETKREILFALYVASVVIVNVVGTKISTIAGIRVSVGIVFMPVLFCIADIMTECFGKNYAYRMANISTAMILLLSLSMFIAIKMPPNPQWGLQKEYSDILGQSLRMSVASFVSFFFSQKIDILIFSFISKITKSRYLFIRNNISTIISQFIDTTVFEFAAFWHLNEKFTAPFIFSLIWPYWIFKIVCSLLDTPFCYLGVYWCGKEKEDKQK